MGELERQDWREVLAPYKIEEVLGALTRIMQTKREYNGRPGVVEVVQAIDTIREESAAKYKRRESERLQAEMRDLKKQREEHPELFIGIADVFMALREQCGENFGCSAEAKTEHTKINIVSKGKTMPTRREQTDADYRARQQELAQQAERLKEGK